MSDQGWRNDGVFQSIFTADKVMFKRKRMNEAMFLNRAGAPLIKFLKLRISSITWNIHIAEKNADITKDPTYCVGLSFCQVRSFFILSCLLVFLISTINAFAQTATYRFHKESSSTSGLFQLKPANPDGTSLAIQTGDLRNTAIGEKKIKEFDTQSGVPNIVGIIPSGSTVTLAVWMKKTANFGTMYPRAKLRLNNSSGTSFCTATGSTALTTTLTKYNISCTTSANITMSATDRYYVWVGVNMTAGNSSNTFKAELDVEGTTNGNYDSIITIPVPVPPTISGLSPTSGSVGTPVTISGNNFGGSQGTSTVKFNGMTSTPAGWSNTSIDTLVPAGATTGQVVVNVGGVNSNGASFSINNAPTASITDPTNNATFIAGSTVTINASASDTDGTVIKVEFFEGTNKLGEDNISPYSFDWTSVSVGTYVLTAKATDNATGIGTSTPVNIIVNSPSISGTVINSIGSGPISGATVKVHQGPTTLSTVSTNGSGGYVFAGLASGTYVVEVTANGFKRQTKAGIIVTTGNVTTVNFGLNADSGPITYAYDEAGRLISVTDPVSGSAIYSYDETGNLLSISRQSVGQVFISSFTPGTGGAGTPVTIFGSGFSAIPSQNAVQFNGTTAAVTSSSATQITTSVPTGATTGSISVTSPSGSATSGASFVVSSGTSITSFTPNIGAAGTAVVINGTGFSTVYPGNEVEFNGVNTAVTSSTTTSINTNVPATATSGKIAVTNQSGSAISTEDFFVVPQPFAVNDVDPSSVDRITVGGNKTLSLNANGFGKVGMLIFEGTAGQKLNLQMTGSGFPSGNVTVYDPHGGSLIDGPVAGIGAIFDLPVLKSNGTYMILVAPQGSEVGDLTLSVNVTSSGASLLSAGGLPVTTSIKEPGQTSYVRFDSMKGKHIKLEITGRTLADGYAGVLDPEMINVGNMQMGSVEFCDFVIMRKTGTYTIDLKSTYNVGNVTYSLTEIADTTSVITSGTPVQVAFSDYFTNTRLTFSASASDKVKFDITDITFPGSFTIFDSDWNIVVEEWGYGLETSMLAVPFMPASGTYTLLVNPYVQAVIPANANVALTLTNNVSGTATVNGAVLPITVASAGQHVQITFAGTAAQRVNLQFSSVTIPSSTVVLKAPDGTTLSSSPLTTLGGVIDVTSLTATGTYAIQVTVDNDATGSFNFDVSSVTPGTPVAITSGGAYVTSVVTASGQTPQLSFSGTIGQRIAFGNKGEPSLTGNVVINSPDSSILDSTPVYGSIFTPLYLPGLYTVSVTPETESTGSATFSLSDTPPETENLLTLGTEHTVTGGSGEKVWWGYDGTAGQKINFTATYNDQTFTSYTISVYSPDGSLLISPEVVGPSFSATVIENVELTETGRYLVLLNPAPGYAVNGKLQVSDASDLMGTIVADGSNVSVSVEGRNARYTFSGTIGQTFYINASNASGGGTVSLRGPDDSVLGAPVHVGYTGCCGLVSSASTEPFTLTQNGTYSVLLDPDYRESVSATLALKSGTADTAGSITIGGSSVTVTTTAAKQKAKLTFSGTAGQHIKLEVSSVSIPGTTKISILRADGSTLGNYPYGPIIGVSNIGTGGGIIDVPSLPATETYSITVDPSEDNVGSVTLTLSSVTDVSGSLPGGGTVVPVTISTAYRNAKLTFSGTAGQHLKFLFNNVTISSAYVTIYAPDGSPVVGRNGYTTVTSLYDGLEIVLPFLQTTGTYTILIDPFEDQTGSLDTSFTSITDVAKTLTVGGSAVASTVSTAGQNVKATFTGTSGQHLSLRLSSVTVSSANISVYKPDGTPVAPQISVGTSGGYFDIPTVPTTGTYTVIADFLENTGNMTFTLSSFTDVTGTLNSGTPLAIIISTQRQNARPTFTGTAGEKISLNITGVTITGSYVSIIKPDGTKLTEPVYVSVGGMFIDNTTLPVTGTYTVLVDPENTKTGAATLTLYSIPDIIGSIAAGGSSVSVSLSSPGQNAKLTLSGTASDKVMVLAGNSSSVPVTVRLLKPDGSELASVFGTGNFTLPVRTLATTGNYTIEIDPDSTSTGTLNITVINP